METTMIILLAWMLANVLTAVYDEVKYGDIRMVDNKFLAYSIGVPMIISQYIIWKIFFKFKKYQKELRIRK